MKIAVIGSGPSALASVWALLNFDVDITVFDTHITEGDLGMHIPSPFPKKMKLAKGSDYPYRHFSSGPKYETNGMAIPYSFAFGGLSTVWGATMLPYSSEDVADWPIYMQDLSEQYNFISGRIPIARMKFEDSRYYKDYSNTEGLLISKRIQALLENSSNSMGDFEYGVTSLAVQVSTLDKKGCIYCKKCLDGCPYGYIWSTTQEWVTLRDTKRIKLHCGVRVMKVNDTTSGVNFIGVERSGLDFKSEFYDHLILATGSIESFRISALSGLFPASATLKDSKTFLVPFIHRKSIKEISNLGFSLSQAYLRASTRRGSIMHLQFYSFSDSLVKRAHLENWLIRLIPIRLLRFVMNKMIYAISYLPDRDSIGLRMHLNSSGEVIFEKEGNKLKKSCISNLLRASYLPKSYVFRGAKIWPIRIMIRFLSPGLGAHYGGWAPAGISTDVSGRLNPNSRIHLVDSSVLPSIPAGPITFTVMANAVRIVNQVFK